MWYSWGAWAQVRTSSTSAMHTPKNCPLIARITRSFSWLWVFLSWRLKTILSLHTDGYITLLWVYKICVPIELHYLQWYFEFVHCMYCYQLTASSKCRSDFRNYNTRKYWLRCLSNSRQEKRNKELWIILLSISIVTIWGKNNIRKISVKVFWNTSFKKLLSDDLLK